MPDQHQNSTKQQGTATPAEAAKPKKRRHHRRRNSSQQRKAKRRQFAQSEENGRIKRAMRAAVYPTREAVRRLAAAVYDQRLSTQRLFAGSFRHRRPIDEQVEFELRRWEARGRDPLAYFYFDGRRELGHQRLRRLFDEQNPALVGKKKFVSDRGHWVDVTETVDRRLDRLWKTVLETDIFGGFSVAHILAQLGKNPHYPFVHQRLQARQALLRRIPDHIPDLFPLARELNRHFIFHVGPTNSGKTHDAIVACESALRGVYLAPLRLLAMEIAERMNADGVACSMVTGEEENRIPGANHMASTIEMMSEEQVYDVAVIDECQLIADRERGWAWTQAVLGIAAATVHACMAPEALPLMRALVTECGDSFEVVPHERATPLAMEPGDVAFPEDVRPGDALVVFSRRSVLQAASMLEDAGRRVSVIYGALPYAARRAETHKFLSGETDMVVATDAIGMGMNLPVKRIVFLETRKFDGVEKRELTIPEVKQIAGRAGRRGYAEKGWVNASFDRERIAGQLAGETPAIATARTTMPRFLAKMDRPLSETMQDWQGLPDEGIYQKTDMSRAIALCLWLEQHCPLDKISMLRAITIPFAEDDEDMLAIWQQAMRNVQVGRPVLGRLSRVACQPGDGLDALEKKHRLLDLYYYLQRSFGDRELYADLEKKDILDCKQAVSAAIVRRLKKAKRVYKRCRICGKKLLWNDPKRICDACYHKMV